MEEPQGTEQVDTSAPVEEVTTPGPDQDSSPEQSSGGNPSWEPLREALGPQFFQLAEPHLKEFDKQAQSRITKLNSDLKTYSSLGTPDELSSYARIAQRLDSEPESVYEALGQFLKENGRMPETEAEVAEAVEDYEQGDEYEDPRLKQIEESQQKLMEYIEAQQQQQRAYEADVALDEELKSVREAFPQLDESDLKEVIQRSAFLSMNGNDVNLADVAADYIENVVNRIRSAQRPGATAPRLLPTGGGSAPTRQQGPSLGEMPKGDVQSIVASFLEQNKG